MIKATNKTGLVFFPAFDWEISPTHPERKERLLYTRDQVQEEGIFDVDGISELKPSLITSKDIQRVHFCIPNENKIATESHLISGGGAKTIGKAVLDKKIDKGFALVRPPGHHAMRIAHGGRGFCNINIEAIMLEYLRTKYNVGKVAVIDTDCHHGDGTSDIYWHDPNTLFISIHQDGRTLYPGTGFPNEQGGPNAVGTNINIPLPPGTGTEGYLYTIKNVVLPILDQFEPELIVNSAGQDNHYTDPLTNMNFTAQGYAELTTLLNPDIAVLEGGYSIEGALPYVNVGIILAMAGLDYSHVMEPDYNPEMLKQTGQITNSIKRICKTTLLNWKNQKLLKEQAQKNHTFVNRKRDVFYDTDMIRESQNETICICKKCAGSFYVDSYASTGKHIYCVQIPINACSKCYKQGISWYKNVKGKFDMVILQDRMSDDYTVK